jgi:hypothetical protein
MVGMATTTVAIVVTTASTMVSVTIGGIERFVLARIGFVEY